MQISSVFDILGPVMIGPSSSHTAGAVRLGLLARAILGEPPTRAKLTLYGSFATTGFGHGADRGLVAGLLGFHADDPAIRGAMKLADERGLSVTINTHADDHPHHPNTVEFEVHGDDDAISMFGSSLGGGEVSAWQLGPYRCELDGKFPTLLVLHRDRPGMIGRISSQCGESGLNISRLESRRDQPGGMALTIVSLDDVAGEELIDALEALENMEWVRYVNPVGAVRMEGVLEIPEAFYESDWPFDRFVDEIVALENCCNGRSAEAVLSEATSLVTEMKLSLELARSDHGVSATKLVGGEYAKMHALGRKGFLNGLTHRVAADAMAVAAASAMALKRASSGTIFTAAALALKNHLGLTCDPVGGRVEIPCVKRNAFSAVAALTACDLTAAGIASAIPLKDVIDAMAQTGRLMSPALKETQQAGLAETVTGRQLADD